MITTQETINYGNLDKRNPPGDVVVMSGSHSPFLACLSMRRLPEIRTSQTLSSLPSLFFHPKHPLQMVKENPPWREKDKASCCHDVFPTQRLVPRIPWEGYYK